MSQGKINSKTVIRKIFESPDAKSRLDKSDQLSAFVKGERASRPVLDLGQGLALWSFGKNEFGGLDLGNDTIKFVLLKRERRNLVLRDLQVEKVLPTDGKQESEERERLNVLVKIATRAKSNAKVAISLNDPALYVDLLKVPHGSEDELREAVRKEMTERNLVDSENSFFDFAPAQGRSQAAQGAVDELLVAAAPKHLIYREFEVVQGAGFKVEAVEPGALAAFQAVSRVRKWQAGERIVILDIGHRFSNLSLVIGGRLAFNRIIPVAGERFTKAVADALGVNMLKAEQLKIQHGLQMLSSRAKEPGSSALTQELLHPSEPEKVSQVLESEVEKLLSELERSFQFAFAKDSDAEGQKISGMILLGGSARMKSLSSFLGERLEVPVQDIDLWSEIEIDARTVDKELLDEVRLLTAVALGLGLRIGE